MCVRQRPGLCIQIYMCVRVCVGGLCFSSRLWWNDNTIGQMDAALCVGASCSPLSLLCCCSAHTLVWNWNTLTLRYQLLFSTQHKSLHPVVWTLCARTITTDLNNRIYALSRCATAAHLAQRHPHPRHFDHWWKWKFPKRSNLSRCREREMKYPQTMHKD